ncbi:MAG: hypothetical protein MR278_09470 [Bacteroidales bacterium]|nr:hypothetical protein [Anaerotignum sp.]MCI5680182.1 hypothetical protein [Bacteroidales bacterium]MDY3926873.1 hypothetical protein [Anaerotignum sp.]
MLNLVTDRTKADVLRENEKGTYNASDLNRVGEAAAYIKELTIRAGYPVVGVFRTDWREGEIPLSDEMNYYLGQVRKCRDCFIDLGIPLPDTIDGLDFIVANNIEKLFVEIEKTIVKIGKTKIYCGTTDCGGDILL